MTGESVHGERVCGSLPFAKVGAGALGHVNVLVRLRVGAIITVDLVLEAADGDLSMDSGPCCQR